MTSSSRKICENVDWYNFLRYQSLIYFPLARLAPYVCLGFSVSSVSRSAHQRFGPGVRIARGWQNFACASWGSESTSFWYPVSWYITFVNHLLFLKTSVLYRRFSYHSLVLFYVVVRLTFDFYVSSIVCIFFALGQLNVVKAICIDRPDLGLLSSLIPFPFLPFYFASQIWRLFFLSTFFSPRFPVRRFGISLWCFKRNKDARYWFRSWYFRLSYFFHCALVLYLVLMTCPTLFFSKKIRRGDRFLRRRWIQSVGFIWTYGMGYCRQMRSALKGRMEMYVKDNPRYVLAISVAKYILLG